jgi:CTP-dependent riboflavin kinase
MIIIHGRIHEGNKDFTKRMVTFKHLFAETVGEELFPGTLNVRIDRNFPIQPHFKIRGAEIDEPDQDLLFEICRVNGHWAYRIRPFRPADGGGGHGDHILEFACPVKLRDQPGFDESNIAVAFFR